MKLRRCRCSHGTQAYRDHVLLEAELFGVVAEEAAEEVSSGEIWADEMPIVGKIVFEHDVYSRTGV